MTMESSKPYTTRQEPEGRGIAILEPSYDQPRNSGHPERNDEEDNETKNLPYVADVNEKE